MKEVTDLLNGVQNGIPKITRAQIAVLAEQLADCIDKMSCGTSMAREEATIGFLLHIVASLELQIGIVNGYAKKLEARVAKLESGR